MSSISGDSGAWLSAGVTPKTFAASNCELVVAICRRKVVGNSRTPSLQIRRYRLGRTPACFNTHDGGARPKPIDPFGFWLPHGRV